MEPRMSRNEEIITELIAAYWMEIETVQNYIANSTNLDGVRAEEIRKSLLADVPAELGHAQSLAKRIRILGGIVPGSKAFRPTQHTLQPPQNSTDVAAVIRGVIEAEQSAITQYKKLIKLCEGEDYATQDLCVELLADEEEHLREFQGFLREYERAPGT
jgi:bacterioferritin